MKLLICEKPKVAEKIAYALGHGSAAKKNLYGVPYYEVERDGQKIVIVSAVGHLYTLRQSEGAREPASAQQMRGQETKSPGYPVFNVEWAPTYEVEKDSDYSKKYLDAIKKLAPGADEYICACDFDIEGSLIGYNIIRFACGAGAGTGSRMKFSALTNDDLENAFLERGPLDMPNALAGEARHMLDWFYGINLSRALMASMRSAGAHQIMSIGRVQGPALAILAKKEKEISAFVSHPYWEVSCLAKGVRFMHERGRFEKKEEATAALSNSGTPGTVQKVEKREYLQAPPPPFDLTSLQVEAYRLFGFAPALTLSLAQTLYEGSLISYPRTSSQKLPSKLNLRRIIEALAKNPAYAKQAGAILAAGRFVPLEGKKDDPAHPAIYPTGMQGNVGDVHFAGQNASDMAPRSHAEREMKLYDLIAKRFLSCFAQPATREAQKVKALSGREGYVTSGNRTVSPGWFDIYAPYLKLEEIALPPFSEGEQLPLAGFKIDEKKTQPPKRYTPASVVSELEKLGLGTKATRASIVETLFKRGYLEGKSIEVTPFGMAVSDLLSKVAPEIMDEELTRGIEDEMEKIQDGENEKKAIDDGKKLLNGILTKFEGKEKDIGFGLLSGLKKKEMGDNLLGKCIKCGNGTLRVIRSHAGKQFVGCSNYPNCNATYPLPHEAKIIPLGTACEKCGTPQIRVIRKARRPFEMCINPQCETKANWGKYPAKPAQAKPQSAAQKTINVPSTIATSAPAAIGKKPAAKKKKTPAKTAKKRKTGEAP